MQKIIIIIIAIIISSISSFSQQLKEEVVITYCDLNVIKTFLNKLDVEYEFASDSEDSYLVSLQGYSVMMGVENRDLLFLTFFKESDVTMNWLNNLNQKIHGKVFISKETLIYMDKLEFTGGVTMERLHNFFKTYVGEFSKIESHF